MSLCARAGSLQITGTEEVRSCHGDDNHFLVIDVDTTVADPSLHVQVHGSSGDMLHDWTVVLSELRHL